MTELHKNFKAFHAKTRKDWRKWLEKNHQSEKKVWLIIYHKESKTPSIYYDVAVEEALCFGWIDSTPNKRDKESYYLSFTPRKPKSVWSKINRERVTKLAKQKLIMPAGKKMIDLAKKTGTWEVLNDIDNIVIPEDLKKEFKKNKKAFENFQAFAPSSKKIILLWISTAKKTATREKRIKESVALAAKNIKANHYRQ